MDDESTGRGWWKTLPGILTALAAVVTAVTGLVVGLHQVGFFRGADEPPRRVSAQASPREGTDGAAPTGAAAEAATATNPDAPYRGAVPRETEVRAGPLVYTILSTDLQRYSENALSLRVQLRITNDGVRWGIAVGPDFFRLRADRIALAPRESVITVVAFQSSEEGEVSFTFPSTATSLVLQVGEVGAEVSEIPVELQVATNQ